MYAAGEQAHVPLLACWNSEEVSYVFLLMDQEPTVEHYRTVVRERFGERAEQVFQLYPAATDEEVITAATDLASDTFTGYSTWKWAQIHGQTGGRPVYRYLYAHPRPSMRPEMDDAVGGLAGGVLRGKVAEAQRLPPAKAPSTRRTSSISWGTSRRIWFMPGRMRMSSSRSLCSSITPTSS